MTSSRQQHARDVRVWDARAHESPIRPAHPTARPRVTSVELHWTRRHVGMTPTSMAGAACALSRRTSNRVTVERSRASVASWRLRKGDVVSVRSARHADDMRPFRTRRTSVVRPQFRPFSGFSLDVVDDAGNCTLPLTMPMAFPALETYYERLVPLCSVPGRTVQIHTNAASLGGSVVEQRERGIRLLTGLGLPRQR